MRPYGISLSNRSSASGVSHAARLMAVLIAPGAIALTRMPFGATSCASDFIIIWIPPLDAA
jgi:hypothetical protein